MIYFVEITNFQYLLDSAGSWSGSLPFGFGKAVQFDARPDGLFRPRGVHVDTDIVDGGVAIRFTRFDPLAAFDGAFILGHRFQVFVVVLVAWNRRR